MSFDSLKNILPKSFQKKSGGVARQIETALVMRQFRRTVEIVWHSDMAERISGVSLKDGTLTIAARSPAAAAEFHLKAHEVKEKINSHFGKTVIRGFFIRL